MRASIVAKRVTDHIDPGARLIRIKVKNAAAIGRDQSHQKMQRVYAYRHNAQVGCDQDAAELARASSARNRLPARKA
jgi:hypothetical protein